MKNLRKSACKFVCVSSFCISNGLFGNSATALGLSDVLSELNQDIAIKFLRSSNNYENVDYFMMESGLGPDFNAKMEKGMAKLIGQFGAPDFHNFEEWLIGTDSQHEGFVQGFLDLLTNSLVDEGQTFAEFLKENSSNVPLMRNIENMVNNLMGGLADAIISQMSGNPEGIDSLLGKIDAILAKEFPGVSFDSLSSWGEGLVEMLAPDSSDVGSGSTISSAAYDALSDFVFRRGQNFDQMMSDGMMGSGPLTGGSAVNYEPGLMVEVINELIDAGIITPEFNKDNLTQAQLNELATFDVNNLTAQQQTKLASFGLDDLDANQLEVLVALKSFGAYDPANLNPMQEQMIDFITVLGFDPVALTPEQGQAFFFGTADGKGAFIPKFMNLFVKSITGDTSGDLTQFLLNNDTAAIDLGKSIESVLNDLISSFDGKESIFGFSTFAELENSINAQFLKTFNGLVDPYDVSTWNQNFINSMEASFNDVFSEVKKEYNELCPNASTCSYVISYEDGIYSPKLVPAPAA